MGNYLNKLDEKLQAIDKQNYRREQYQSYMTGPEWRNVEMAKEYGDFLREGKSMFQFPYFRQIGELWKVFYQSFKAARKYNTRREIIFSEYFLMDVFVCSFTTIELIPKGLLSLILYPFLKKENQSKIQENIAEYYAKYAADLQTKPFYDHAYKEIRAELQKNYKQCEKRTWVDWFSFKVASIELLAKRLISAPLHYWYHQEDNEVPPTTDILVKFRAKGHDNFESARTAFKTELASLDESHHLNIVEDQLYVKEKVTYTENNECYVSVYARLSAPRYKAFHPALKALTEKEILLRKIAAQDNVQVKCVIDSPNTEDLKRQCDALGQNPKTPMLYNYNDHIKENRSVCLFDVSVKDLQETVEQFEKQENVTLEFIHNF